MNAILDKNDEDCLTMEQLQKELENEEYVPFWKMNPETQHVLRCFAEHNPETVEQICNDDNCWQPFTNKVCQMFLEPYRLKSGCFSVSFVNGQTCFRNWKFRHMRYYRRRDV
jgi:hypothetical protein